MELTRGVPSPAWEKKRRPLGKNDVPDTRGVLFCGLVSPGGFCGVVGGLVKWPHCFCVRVMKTHPVQHVVIIELSTENSSFSLVTHKLKAL